MNKKKKTKKNKQKKTKSGLFIIFRAITIDMNNPFVTNGYVSARYFCDRE